MLNRRRLLSLGATGMALSLAGCVFGDDEEESTPSPTPSPSPGPEPPIVSEGSTTLYDGLLYETWTVEVLVPDGGVLLIRTRQVELFGGNPVFLINDETQGTLAPYRREYVELEPGEHEITVDLPQGSVPDVTIELHHPDAIDPDDYKYPINTEIFEVTDIPATLIEAESYRPIQYRTDELRCLVRSEIPTTVILEVHELETRVPIGIVASLNENEQFYTDEITEPGTYAADFTKPGEILFRLTSPDRSLVDGYTVSVRAIETDRFQNTDSLELVDISAPEEVLPEVLEGGEAWTWSITVENTAEYASVLESHVLRYLEGVSGGLWLPHDDFRLVVVPDRESTYESDERKSNLMVTHRYQVEALDAEFEVKPDVTQLKPEATIESDDEWGLSVGPIEAISGVSTAEEWSLRAWLSVTNTRDEARPIPAEDNFVLVGSVNQSLSASASRYEMDDLYSTQGEIGPDETVAGWALAPIQEDMALDELGIQIGETMTPGESYLWTTADEFGPFYSTEGGD